ncbi:glycosyltransferase [Membranihabitans maritimus]|uniref:glycosyltransferase n=1 Tax=Membranihabitans maritimus TaxID=2904244 RepID=UPI001F24008D|nr:glycosyltransferase [Membranihabitans maritimus]
MKKLLLLTYYWPPAGGPGVQRALYFVKYLRKYGWEPVVYTVENGEFHNLDSSLEKEIPEGTKVLKHPIWEPYSLYKSAVGTKKGDTIKPVVVAEKTKRPLLQNLAVWVRGNFFIPDARRFWIKPSIKFLGEYLESSPVDAIYSTSPPQSVHLIALGLKEKLGTPWLADFRDPWTKVVYYDDLKLSKWADKKHRNLEKAVLTGADRIVAASYKLQQEFSVLGDREVDVVTNGFDTEMHFEDREEAERFTLLHLGSVTAKRNPEQFWVALEEIINKTGYTPSEFCIEFIGSVHPDIVERLKELGLMDFVIFKEFIPHDEIWEPIDRASTLLLINNKGQDQIIPAKLFEYLVSKTPILGIADSKGDVARIINESGRGIVVDFDDKERFKEQLQMLFIKHKSGSLRREYLGDRNRISTYSRQNLTGDLVKILDEMTE